MVKNQGNNMVINYIKIGLSKILYYIGDFISKFLRWSAFSFLYPVYRKIMLWSCDLDKDGAVWKRVEKRKLHE